PQQRSLVLDIEPMRGPVDLDGDHDVVPMRRVPPTRPVGAEPDRSRNTNFSMERRDSLGTRSSTARRGAKADRAGWEPASSKPSPAGKHRLKPRQLFRTLPLQAPRAPPRRPRPQTETPSSSARMRRGRRTGAPRIVDATRARHRQAPAYGEIVLLYP